VSNRARSTSPTASRDGTVLQYDVGAGGALLPATSVTTGPDAWEVAVSPDSNSVYVANPHSDSVLYSDTVSQYDVGILGLVPKDKPIAFIDSPGAPFGIAVRPDGNSVYVTYDSGVVAQFDVGVREPGGLTTKSPATVPAGNEPADVAVSPDGDSVYVANQGGGVSQYDVGPGGALSPKSPATVAPALGTSGIAVRRTTVGAPPPAPTIADVIASVRALDLPAGIERALLAKLTGAQRDLAANDHGGACGKLGAFINQVKAQDTKKIAATDTQALTDQATAVSHPLGCAG